MGVNPADTSNLGTDLPFLQSVGENRVQNVLRRLVTVVTVSAAVASVLFALSAPVGALSASGAAASRTIATNGPLEAVPGMQSGLPASASASAVLGTLGSDLYLFGSQAETAGAIKGVWRYRSGNWTKLGEARLDLDYNRLAMYGAVEYKGSLYVGDRHTGNLYKLVLNADGSFQDVVSLAKVGGEDVFPGPIWNGNMVLGTFGSYWTGENSGLYTYDGAAVSKRFDFSDLGNASLVTSIVPFGNDIWVTGINSTATLSQVWKFDRSYKASLIYSGPLDHRLVTSGRRLFAIASVFSYPLETHYFTEWQGNGFVKISNEIGPFGMIGSIGAIDLNGTLLDLCYYNGIYSYRAGTLEQMVPGMPEMGAPGSVEFHDGYLWISSNQPVGLYRMKIGT